MWATIWAMLVWCRVQTKKPSTMRWIVVLFEEFKIQMGDNPQWLPGSLTEPWIKGSEIVHMSWGLRARRNEKKQAAVDDWTALVAIAANNLWSDNAQWQCNKMIRVFLWCFVCFYSSCLVSVCMRASHRLSSVVAAAFLPYLSFICWHWLLKCVSMYLRYHAFERIPCAHFKHLHQEWKPSQSLK